MFSKSLKPGLAQCNVYNIYRDGLQTDEDLMVKDFLFILFMLSGDLFEADMRRDKDMMIQ